MTPAPNNTLAHKRRSVCEADEGINGSAPCDKSHLSLMIQNFVTSCEDTVTGLQEFTPKD